MKFLSLLSVIVLLTGCASVLPKGPPTPTLYTLSTPASQPVESASVPASLRILMPQAAPGLDTEKIALRKADNQMDYYTGVRWTGSLNALVQTQLVQRFDDTKQLASVSNDLVAVNQDYSLLVEIQDFQMEYANNTPTAHIHLTAKLIQTDKNKIITTAVYNETETAKENTMDQVIKAFDAAYQRASSNLVADTLRTLTPKAVNKAAAPRSRKKA